MKYICGVLVIAASLAILTPGIECRPLEIGGIGETFSGLGHSLLEGDADPAPWTSHGDPYTVKDSDGKAVSIATHTYDNDPKGVIHITVSRD